MCCEAHDDVVQLRLRAFRSICLRIVAESIADLILEFLCERRHDEEPKCQRVLELMPDSSQGYKKKKTSAHEPSRIMIKHARTCASMIVKFPHYKCQVSHA